MDNSEELTALIKKCDAIVAFFHRSASAEEMLKEEQKKNNPNNPPLKLISDVETRWNSQFDMLERLIKVRSAINAVLCEPDMPHHISSCEWSRITDYRDCLKVFKEATDLMTQANTATLSNYVLTIYGLRQTVGNINNCDAIAAFRNQLLSKLNERFNFIEEAKSLFIAMLLDPRIKDRLLSGDKKAWANTVLRSIALEYLDVSNASESNGRTGVPPNEPSGECETIIRLCVTVFNVVCYILCLYDRIIASGKYPPIFMQHWKR